MYDSPHVRPYLDYRVNGAPAPQGSKRHVGNGVMVESSRAVAPWREAVRSETQATLAESGATCISMGPVGVRIVFILARPAHHYGTGRNAGRLKASAPRWVSTVPDIDKLTRAVLDGMVAGGAVADDRQVAALIVSKRYTGSRDEVPGARIRVWELEESWTV